MDIKGKHIILGSNSPRRKELLAGMGIPFDVDTRTGFDENFASLHDDPATLPARMSEGKSLGFHRPLSPGEILITADTLVLCEGEALGKPKDRADAVRMLKKLSGKPHSVITAVTLRSLKHSETVSDEAIVYFKELSDDEINYYVDTFKPFDKAGAYAIQEWIGFIGIPKIDGSFYTIMGFPVALVYKELLSFIEE